MANIRTHFTWSIEPHSGQCPFCSGKTILMIAPCVWDADYETSGDKYIDGVQVSDELTGNFCPTCDKLVSVSLNTV